METETGDGQKPKKCLEPLEAGEGKEQILPRAFGGIVALQTLGFGLWLPEF